MPYARPDPARKARYNHTYYEKNKAKRRHASSEDDRKVPFHGRFPERLLARIQRLTLEGIATGRYPWKTTAEAMVNLLHRGLISMKGDPMIDDMLPYLEMKQHLDHRQAQRREAQSILNTARSEIKELQAIGAARDAITCYHVTAEAARKMPATIWRDWLIGCLKKEFKELHQQRPVGVSLMARAKAPKHSA